MISYQTFYIFLILIELKIHTTHTHTHKLDFGMKEKENRNLAKHNKFLSRWQGALRSWGVLLDMTLDEAWEWMEEVSVLWRLRFGEDRFEGFVYTTKRRKEVKEGASGGW